jgi:hypothetical protein
LGGSEAAQSGVATAQKFVFSFGNFFSPSLVSSFFSKAFGGEALETSSLN